jgi:alpha-L-fucosidase 2
VDLRPAAPPHRPTSRRGFLSLAAATGAVTALGGLPAFTAAASPRRPLTSPPPAEGATTELWWQAPASEHSMIEQGLPVGNGRLGALASNDPGAELLLITDATPWTGGINGTLDQDGQFPYAREKFGSFTLLGRLTVEIPDHDLSSVSDYRRTLDLGQGLVTTSYVRSGVTYRRQIFASRPDDVIVLHLTQDGGGRHTGTITTSTRWNRGAASSRSTPTSAPPPRWSRCSSSPARAGSTSCRRCRTRGPVPAPSPAWACAAASSSTWPGATDVRPR